MSEDNNPQTVTGVVLWHGVDVKSIGAIMDRSDPAVVRWNEHLNIGRGKYLVIM